jgi:hypothetical protein
VDDPAAAEGLAGAAISGTIITDKVRSAVINARNTEEGRPPEAGSQRSVAVFQDVARGLGGPHRPGRFTRSGWITLSRMPVHGMVRSRSTMRELWIEIRHRRPGTRTAPARWRQPRKSRGPAQTSSKRRFHGRGVHQSA